MKKLEVIVFDGNSLQFIADWIADRTWEYQKKSYKITVIVEPQD